MIRITRNNRCFVLAGVAAFVLNALFSAVATAQFPPPPQNPIPQPPPPPLEARAEIQKENVNATTYRARLVIYARVPGIATNTFETDWVLLNRGTGGKSTPRKIVGIFSVNGNLEWTTGNDIKASVTVEATVNGRGLSKTFSLSVPVPPPPAAPVVAPANPLPDPPLEVSCKIEKQNVDKTTYRARLVIVARLPGVATNTFETDWVLLKKGERKSLPRKMSAGFTVTGELEWTGNNIVATVNVEARINKLVKSKGLKASIPA